MKKTVMISNNLILVLSAMILLFTIETCVLIFVNSNLSWYLVLTALLRIMATLGLEVIMLGLFCLCFWKKLPLLFSSLIQWIVIYGILYGMNCYRNNWVVVKPVFPFIIGMGLSWFISYFIVKWIKKGIRITHVEN